MARHQFIVSKFIRMVLRYCKNRPKFIVDREFGMKTLSKNWDPLTKTKPLEKEIV